jgi:hypothetical protein
VSPQGRDKPQRFDYVETMQNSQSGIPTERAPLLLVFSDLAGRMAALVRVRPSLIANLIVAPREAIHSVGAYLHLAADAGLSDAEIAASIDETDPRNLLRAALPDAPPRLFRALDRAGDRVRDKRFYERLGTLCAGPFAGALLQDGRIDDARLSYYEALSRMDPALVGLQSVLDGDTYLAESIDCLIALLRSHSTLRDSDLHLPSKAGKPAIARRLRAALGRIQAPDPGFAAPPPFRLVRTSDELQQIGRAFGNCVALPEWNAPRYQIQLAQGSMVFLVAKNPPVLTSLIRVAHGVWHLEQMCGPKNTAPAPGMRANLIRDLASAGQRMVMMEPDAALSRLVQERQHRRAAIENDQGVEDDEDREDDADGIAA